MSKKLSRPLLIFLTISATVWLGFVVPVRSVSYQLHSIILIDGNAAFTVANGVTSGTGTNTYPYIIENWNITHPADSAFNYYAILIRNTRAYFIIRNVYLCGGGLSSIGVELDNVTNGQVQTSSMPNCARSTTGIGISYSHNITIYNNNLRDGRSLLLSHSSNVTALANSFVTNIVAVDHSNNSIFSTNNFFGGSLELSFSRSILVFRNNFLNICDTCIMISEGVDNNGNLNHWDNGYPAGGNYWINYTGVDRCSSTAQNICQLPDGIGDTPYVLGNVTDHYPLMKAYGDSSPPVWGSSGGVKASLVDKSTVRLNWFGATDDLGIVGYRIYQDGQFLLATSRNRAGQTVEAYTVTGLNSGAIYNFKVLAVDVANNTSGRGPSLDVTIPAQWWQITSLVWWQVNWLYSAALIGFGIAIMTWVVLSRGKVKQKHLTDFSTANPIPISAVSH
jgi:hypothetical protein